jgi:hypothetical protein
MVEGGRHHVVNEEITKRQQIYQWLQQEING